MVETLLLTFCIYGLMRSGNALKMAAFTSFLAYPSILLFTKAGASGPVLLLLALEAVPLAFALLLVRVYGKVNFRRLWKRD